MEMTDDQVRLQLHGDMTNAVLLGTIIGYTPIEANRSISQRARRRGCAPNVRSQPSKVSLQAGVLARTILRQTGVLNVQSLTKYIPVLLISLHRPPLLSVYVLLSFTVFGARTMRFQGLITILSAFYGFVETASAASTFSFTQCANDATSVFLSAPNSSFLVASDGTFTSNLTKAWGIRYESCNNLCGPPGGWEAFDWIFFSTSVSAWVLPWLALTAQLPYETRSSFNNLLSLLLAVGSPMLITYSLCLTILNSRWINKYFRSLRDNNEELRGKQVKALKAARTFLRESQHVPIKVQQSRAEFAQLVVLPQNRTWWESLRKEVIKSKREWNVYCLFYIYHEETD